MVDVPFLYCGMGWAVVFAVVKNSRSPFASHYINRYVCRSDSSNVSVLSNEINNNENFFISHRRGAIVLLHSLLLP